jgi:hypothetical protein
MYVHTLEFASEVHMARAFSHLMSCEYVQDCLVEAPSLRVRFTSSAQRASTLIERIYMDGGLRWCARQRLKRSS